MFVVENEIASHDAIKHIGNQLLRFVTSFDDGDRLKIRDSIMENIHTSEESKRRLEEGCSHSEFRNIYEYLEKAVSGEFRSLVVIDEARNPLHKVLTNIKADISVLEFKSYKSVDGDYAYEFDTLYEENFEPIGKTTTNSEELTKEARQIRRASCDTIIVPARPDGFEREFIGNNRWLAIRIGAAMKNKIKYLATYQVAPSSAVTHIAEVQEIKLWEDSKKYVVLLKGNPEEIVHIPFNDSKYAPQGPVYVKKDDLLRV